MPKEKLTLSKSALELASQLFVGSKLIKAHDLPENRVGDELFSYFLFQHSHGRSPTNQMLFNDVLYRIKTTDEIINPLRVFVSDKEFVKIFISAIVGSRYNVPTIATLKSQAEVDVFDFPPDCCIKPTHASGLYILRKSGEYIEKETIKKWLSINYYRVGREANYKTLIPKIIVEPLIFNSIDLEDYRFFLL